MEKACNTYLILNYNIMNFIYFQIEHSGLILS
jgi:hypothetical protein